MSEQNQSWLSASRRIGARIKSATPYPQTWVDFDQLGGFGPYRKTFDFAGDFIDAQHRYISEAPGGMFGVDFLIDLGVEGYLHHADALKLYELARLCDGDILELGTHKGLSTSIVASALHNRGAGRLTTVDLDGAASAQATQSLSSRHGSERVSFVVGNATQCMDGLLAVARKFGFVFVDHWHGYRETLDAAVRLCGLLERGGFVLFHDFIDPGNADEGHPYGVYQAVIDTIASDPSYSFYGVFGCCGLFRRN